MSALAAVAEPYSSTFPGLTLCMEHEGRPYPMPSARFWSVETTVAGPLLILSDEKGITDATFVDEPTKELNRLERSRPDTTFNPADRTWLRELETPSQSGRGVIPLSLHGTPFQLEVWHTLLTIPWGETRTYGWIAKTIGRPTACRAVGTAVGSNPVALLVPCHRVLPANGKPGNYAGGSHRKVALLEWEGARFRP